MTQSNQNGSASGAKQIDDLVPGVADQLDKSEYKREIANIPGIATPVAGRVVERFGTNARDTDREQLKTVDGVGKKTARKLNPKTSDAYDAAVNEGNTPDIEGWGPLSYTDEEGVTRLLREKPERARDSLREAVKRANRLSGAISVVIREAEQ
jgi:hypothetical protein